MTHKQHVEVMGHHLLRIVSYSGLKGGFCSEFWLSYIVIAMAYTNCPWFEDR
jgi:hypothetical protein